MVNPKNKLKHLHCFTNPYVSLASFSYGCLRAFGINKVKKKMFAVMDPLGKHSILSSRLEYEWIRYLETQYRDLLHGTC